MERIRWSGLGCVGVLLCCWRAAGQEPDRPPAAETGIIHGTTEVGGQPVPGVTITLVDTELKAVSDANGKFEVRDVPPDRYFIKAERNGFVTIYTAATVVAGQTVEVPVPLLPQEEDDSTVFVVARAPASTGGGMTIQRKGSAQKQDIASRQGMQQTGASTAVDAAKQLPGVSAVDKFIFVRGLGDRYSQTLLNGANLPSPEPDKRAVPVDLFPANLLESISISKTYSPELPGEFSGGSVLIRTVSVPEKPFFTVGSDLKYRHGTSFREFKTYNGGEYDKLSFDDGTRQLPGAVPAETVTGGSGTSGLTDEEIQMIGRSFANIWEADTITAPLDHKLSLSFGDRFGKKGGPSLGIVGAVNWANKYQNIADETRRVVVNTGSIQDPNPEVFNDYKIDTSTFEAELSGLFNATLELNEAQKVGVRTLYTRAGQDEVREQSGIDGQRSDPIQLTRLRWVERSLLSVQPFGEHLLVGDTFLEWRVGYALSQRDEPDNRQVRYIFDPVRRDYVFEDVASSGRRDFYQLDENIYDAALDYSIPFRPFVEDKNRDPDRLSPEQRIRLGPAFVFRDRDFDARRFVFSPVGGTTPVDENGIPINFYGPPEDIFQKKNINPNGIQLEEQTRSTDNYEADQTLIAGYALFDVRLVRDLRLQGGARVESSEQTVTTFELFSPTNAEQETKLEDTDVLPAANLIWEFYEGKKHQDSMQLRLAGSQTVSRPEFRELAPFEYTDVQGGYAARGNPDLQRAKIWNADLAWEWFLSPGEVISAGVFYKHFDQPIEVVNVPLGSTLLTTWENADSGDLYGFEIEARKKLGFLVGDWWGEGTKPAAEAGTETGETESRALVPTVDDRITLNDFSIVTNFALMDSEVRIDKGSGQGLGNLQTNSKRPLQGQSEYLFNIGLLFDSRPLDLSVSIFASATGPRISAVGASGIDDEVEEERWSLDITVLKRFKNGWAIKLSAENLLNDDYSFEQDGIVTRHFRRGVAFGVGVSYTF